MCGIIAAVANRNIAADLIQGLQRLEYRGYDSAGLAVIDVHQQLQRLRKVGKVDQLAKVLNDNPIDGEIGIAHTRWATHGEPNIANAHPHQSGCTIAVVHNGIIENYQSLRQSLMVAGYTFESVTDTEVVAHLIHQAVEQCGEFRQGFINAMAQLRGSFAIACIDRRSPDRVLAKRCGSPLVVGLGELSQYVVSDQLALLTLAESFVVLEEGDVVEVGITGYQILDSLNQPVTRAVQPLMVASDTVSKGPYQHYMHKEIFEQPAVVKQTLEAYQTTQDWLEAMPLAEIAHIQIIACGTSYHAGLVAKYWFEQIASVPCQVDIASEFRYREPAVPVGTLLIAISQSGETADTLAAFRQAHTMPYIARLAICNMAWSSLAREADGVLMTFAGREIGVASTKVFTTQLVVLLQLALVLAKSQQRDAWTVLNELPNLIDTVLQLEPMIIKWAKQLVKFNHILFLGRGTGFPIAVEGALKLKEITYIHAEAYAAGELKHGPLALIDKNMPCIFIAPNDALFEKVMTNISEVSARGGQLFILTDAPDKVSLSNDQIQVLPMPAMHPWQIPFGYVISLQLLAYHVAVGKQTNIDQPRNLAKSVTVE